VPPYKRAAMGKIPFLKMHGLGNDFVVLDGRRAAVTVDAAAARALADRRTGIGCDQVIVLERPRHPGAQVLMRIHNPDGGEAEACGNATRCVADLLRREIGSPQVRIETIAGPRSIWDRRAPVGARSRSPGPWTPSASI